MGRPAMMPAVEVPRREDFGRPPAAEVVAEQVVRHLREAAVAVVGPSGWLELFLDGVAVGSLGPGDHGLADEREGR